ncbi:MAG: ankyrin repeat domain-containing protein [Proteobacteria bacterium]|nr:ankyrin repeat domain-containing protein [Pseudomonadota bacterium]
MPYDKRIQEHLKSLVRAKKIDQFKTIYKAIEQKDTELARQYLYGEHDEGRGLLAWAAMEEGNQNLISYLIKRTGAFVNHQDGKGRTALLLANDHGCVDNAITLIRNGADTEIADYFGATPLHTAAASNSDNTSKLIELLCTAGANVNAQNKQGATPLHIAAKHSLEAIHTIIKYRGQHIDINKKDNDGDTPLHYAAQSETGHNSTYLLMLGADRTITNNDSQTALQVADEWDSEGKDWDAILEFRGGDPEIFYKQVLFDSKVVNILEQDVVDLNMLKQLTTNLIPLHHASDDVIAAIEDAISSNDHNFNNDELLGILGQFYTDIDLS